MITSKHKDVIAAVLLLALACQASARLAVMSIDLGGEFMKIAIVKPGVPMETVLNKDSARKTQTLVAFRDGERQFANEAASTAVKFPAKAFSCLGEVIGRNYDDPQVQRYRERFSYHTLLKDEERGTVIFQLEDGTKYSAEELLGMIMEKAREYAKAFAEQDIKDAVITVPAFYNQAERRAILTAANLVGLNVLQLMSNNAAVALNYGVFRRKNFNSTSQFYMFYDMGSTSTTATVVGYNVVKTKEGTFMESNPQLTIKGVGFDRSLGGLEFSRRLQNHLAKTFNGQKKSSLKVESSNRSMAKLLKEAERVKKVLSANTDHMAQIENLIDEKDFSAMVTRSEFETMTSDLLDRVTKPMEEALKVSEITLPEISEVILMGGGTRLPKVQELLLKYLGRSELGKSINTDEAASLGAVYQAAYLGKGFKVKKFGVREGSIYPVVVEFEKQKSDSDGSEDSSRTIKRTLFSRMNPFPQKKVMTFNKHTKDFSFNVAYGNLEFLTEEERKSFGTQRITSCQLEGVEDALTKHKDSAESKGIKAHFRMDESGLLSLDRVESLFERNSSQQAEAEKSTWSKLGSALGGLFGSSTEEDTKVEDKPEGADDGEEKTTDSGSGGSSGKPDAKEEGPTVTPPSPDSGKDSDSGKEVPKEEGDASKDEPTASEGDGPADESKEEKSEETETKEEEGKEKEEAKEEKGTEDSKEKTDESDSSKKSSNDSTTAEEKEAAKKKEEAAKANATKVTTLKEEIKTQVQVLDLKDLSADQLAESKKRLSDLQAKDKEKRLLEKVKNELEAFIFDLQDKLDGESSHTRCASEDEKTKLLESLSEASDWLYEQGDDTKKEEYSAKLKSLTDASKGLTKRVFELEERPRALDALKSVLNQTTVFFETIKNMSDLEDPIFTPVEMTTLEKLINESRDWRDTKVAEQNKLKPYDTPVLLSEDIAYKISALDREMRYLINKAKNFRPKPKAKDEKKSEGNGTTTKNETTSKKEKDSKETNTETPEKTQEESPPTSTDDKGGPTVDIPGGGPTVDVPTEGETTSTGKRRPKSKRKSDAGVNPEQEEILELDDSSSDKGKEEETGDSTSKDKAEHVEL